jgi:1,4-alpha-glucan branching enzyme
MGGEFGQSGEWNADGELDWRLLEAGPYHLGLQRFVEDLNKLYLANTALWQVDHEPGGFYWIDCSDNQKSVVAFMRQNSDRSEELAVILNLTPVARNRYRVGLPHPGRWLELLNSDAALYGGGNTGNAGGVNAQQTRCHGQPCSAEFVLPPLSIIVFQPEKTPAPS